MFSIHINSFALSAGATQEDREFLAGLSKGGFEILKELYSGIKQSLLNGNSVGKKTDKLIDKSIFILCIPDGLLLIKIVVESSQSFRLKCMLLPKENGMRMGWRLANWKLVFLAAGEVLPTGKYELSMDEISSYSDEVFKNTEQKYRDKIIELGKRIMQESIPVNYAFTNLPPEKLPLDFKGNIISAYSGDSDDTRRMPIDISMPNMLPSHDTFIAKHRINKNFAQYEIIAMSKREYLKTKDDELKIYDKERRSMEMDAIKNDMVYFSDSTVFLCVQISRFKTENIKYTYALPADFAQRIEKGELKAAELFRYTDKAERNALDYFDDYNRVIQEREEERERIQREKQEKRENKEREKEEKRQEKLKHKEEREQTKQYRKLNQYDTSSDSNEDSSDESDIPQRILGKAGGVASAVTEKVSKFGSGFFSKFKDKK